MVVGKGKLRAVGLQLLLGVDQLRVPKQVLQKIILLLYREKNKIDMSRSSWKSSYVENSLLTKVFSNKIKKGTSFSLKTWTRSSTIVSDFVGLRFRLHNGKEFIPLLISSDMVGYKFGEFVPTRVRYEFKKKKKKK